MVEKKKKERKKERKTSLTKILTGPNFLKSPPPLPFPPDEIPSLRLWTIKKSVNFNYRPLLLRCDSETTFSLALNILFHDYYF